MDKYRIKFICKKQPSKVDNLVGFEEGATYYGRHYNGLYEVSPDWGRGQRSVLVSGTTFREYFDLLPAEQTVTAA